MRRVLILAYYLPPIAASGSIRPAGFATHLAEFGWTPHLLGTAADAVHPEPPIDASLERLLPASVEVERLRYFNPLRFLLDLRGRLRDAVRPGAAPVASGAPARRTPVAGEPPLLQRTKAAILERLFLFPDPQKPWYGPAVRRGVAIGRATPIDAVFATGNPWTALLAGNRIAARLNVPFLADFRDPWSNNPKPVTSPRLAAATAALERSVVLGAARVIANTDALREDFQVRYPDQADKIIAITNGYMIDELAPATAGEAWQESGAAVELCHFGSVYELRNPHALLAALADVVAAKSLPAGRLLLRFVGHWGVTDPECNALAARLEADGFLVREPAIARAACIARMRTSQHLLILQQDFPLQIPGKIYEYVATRRPLFVVGGAGATASLVQEHRLGICTPNDRELLARTLTRLLDGPAGYEPPPEESVTRFGYRQLTARLAQTLDECVAQRS